MITAIYANPGYNELVPAYRRTLITAVASDDPVVYFDVYFNAVYYKTISSTIPAKKTGGTNYWQVDIQSAIQEYLNSPIMQGLTYPNVYGEQRSISACYVKVRGSSIVNGAVVPQGPVPVQGTVNQIPVPGGGSYATPFLVHNSALQFEDKQDLRAHLDSFALHTAGWRMYPLSHAPYFNVTMNDYGHLAVLCAAQGGTHAFHGEDFIGVDNIQLHPGIIACIDTNPTIGVEFLFNPIETLYENSVYYIPSAPKTMKQLSTVGSVTIPWSHVLYYRCGLRYSSPLVQGFMCRSPIFYLNHNNCNHTRLRFLNYLGAYESVNFCDKEEVYSSSSSVWKQTPSRFQPPGTTDSRYNQLGTNRFNISSNEKITLTGLFKEEQLPWLKELFDSPKVFIEWEGSQGQTPDFLPIRILDNDVQTIKVDDRYEYEVSVQYTMSNENVTIRS